METAASTIITMGHDGFKRIKGLGWIERQIECINKKIIVHDKVFGEGNRKLNIFYNFNPSCSFNLERNILTVGLNEALIRLVFPEIFKLQLEDASISK